MTLPAEANPKQRVFTMSRQKRGANQLGWLRHQSSYSELERTILDMGVEDLRSAVFSTTTHDLQRRLSPDDYAAWWKGDD